MEELEDSACEIRPVNLIYRDGWNNAIEAAIEAILDIRGTFDGDTILRAREIIKELKR
jgi:hypothetical protein